MFGKKRKKKKLRIVKKKRLGFLLQCFPSTKSITRILAKPVFVSMVDQKTALTKFNVVCLIASEAGYVTSWEVRAFFMAFKREVRRNRLGKMQKLIRFFFPITFKTKGSRMGKGRGRNMFHVARINKGQILLRVRFINEKKLVYLLQFLKTLKQKLRVLTQIVRFSKPSSLYYKQNLKKKYFCFKQRNVSSFFFILIKNFTVNFFFYNRDLLTWEHLLSYDNTYFYYTTNGKCNSVE